MGLGKKEGGGVFEGGLWVAYVQKFHFSNSETLGTVSIERFDITLDISRFKEQRRSILPDISDGFFFLRNNDKKLLTIFLEKYYSNCLIGS